MDPFDFVNSISPEQTEILYQQFKSDPTSVDESWRKFFQGFEFAQKFYPVKQAGFKGYENEFKVINLIKNYRQRGHLFTRTNPVRARRTYVPNLAIENFGLTQADLDKEFHAGNEIGIGKASLRNIIIHLEKTYCSSVGAEFYYVRNPEVFEWLRSSMESSQNSYKYSTSDRKYILKNLSRAVLFERFIHKKFPGQKRFSLEGAESLIPALDAIIEKGAELGDREFIIGMAHRGRLNVLANILKKPFESIFSEFEGKEFEDETLSGDVKYHLGYTSERVTATGKKVKLTLSPNPSHLEAVNPVVEGIVRAKITHEYNRDFNKVTPVLIHGDASIAGQGIVYEVLQMSGVPGYKTGGTVHLVINNQIGFTTNYLEARTSTYCTDVAKTILAPVFHVNGDDVEAVVYTVLLAMEYRNKFHNDVFIDLLCYRKYGHNEGDEPRFTQPLLYKIIEKHPNPLEIYKTYLEKNIGFDFSENDEYERKLIGVFEKNLSGARQIEKARITSFLEENWKKYRKALPQDFDISPDTSIKESMLMALAKKLSGLPEGKSFFSKTLKMMEARKEFISKGNADWALGELMAYGSLLLEGFPVRVSGQDVVRGTFSHRHAMIRIEDSEEEYTPLSDLGAGAANFEIYNSTLSEYGVLGYEYGYSLCLPDGLVIWEAQFGDFSNGAQIILDQFISSAEDKWNVMSGLVVLLPHGYEGQGPEHSSGRMERFLTMAAEQNFQVVNCTTPANFFHVLRRQIHRDFRKPLIVFTPKSLLRHSRCVSAFDEFTAGRFKEIIDDPAANPKKIKKVVFCAGKIYYDLLEEKEKGGFDHVSIVRLEQVYPLPLKQIRELIARYKYAENWLWVQEEPYNMGAWPFIHRELKDVALKVISRPPSGSTATGSSKFHQLQQRKIIDKTFEECLCPKVKESCKMVCIGNRWRSFEKELESLKVDTIDSKSISALKSIK